MNFFNWSSLIWLKALVEAWICQFSTRQKPAASFGMKTSNLFLLVISAKFSFQISKHLCILLQFTTLSDEKNCVEVLKIFKCCTKIQNRISCEKWENKTCEMPRRILRYFLILLFCCSISEKVLRKIYVVTQFTTLGLNQSFFDSSLRTLLFWLEQVNHFVPTKTFCYRFDLLKPFNHDFESENDRAYQQCSDKNLKSNH